MPRIAGQEDAIRELEGKAAMPRDFAHRTAGERAT